MPDSAPLVFIVDDDVSVRESLEFLIRQQRWQPEVFASADEFLSRTRPLVPSCLILDLSLPGLSGLDLQERIANERTEMPIIFITGQGDIPSTVQAMKAGAVEFLTKPFRDQDILDAIQHGLDQDRACLENEKKVTELRLRYETLTPREREVLSLVLTGRPNKQIAQEIGISEITVKVHRGQVMRKMGAASLPNLARMADDLKLQPAH